MITDTTTHHGRCTICRRVARIDCTGTCAKCTNAILDAHAGLPADAAREAAIRRDAERVGEEGRKAI